MSSASKDAVMEGVKYHKMKMIDFDVETMTVESVDVMLTVSIMIGVGEKLDGTKVTWFTNSLVPGGYEFVFSKAFGNPEAVCNNYQICRLVPSEGFRFKFNNATMLSGGGSGFSLINVVEAGVLQMQEMKFEIIWNARPTLTCGEFDSNIIRGGTKVLSKYIIMNENCVLMAYIRDINSLYYLNYQSFMAKWGEHVEAIPVDVGPQRSFTLSEIVPGDICKGLVLSSTVENAIVVGFTRLRRRSPCSCDGRSLMSNSLIKHRLIGTDCIAIFDDGLVSGMIAIESAPSLGLSANYKMMTVNSDAGSFITITGRLYGNYYVELNGPKDGLFVIGELTGTVQGVDDCVAALEDSSVAHFIKQNECTMLDKSSRSIVDAEYYMKARGYTMYSVSHSVIADVNRRYSGSDCSRVDFTEVTSTYGTYGFGTPTCDFCINSGNIPGTLMLQSTGCVLVEASTMKPISEISLSRVKNLGVSYYLGNESVTCEISGDFNTEFEFDCTSDSVHYAVRDVQVINRVSGVCDASTFGHRDYANGWNVYIHTYGYLIFTNNAGFKTFAITNTPSFENVIAEVSLLDRRPNYMKRFAKRSIGNMCDFMMADGPLLPLDPETYPGLTMYERVGTMVCEEDSKKHPEGGRNFKWYGLNESQVWDSSLCFNTNCPGSGKGVVADVIELVTLDDICSEEVVPSTTTTTTTTTAITTTTTTTETTTTYTTTYDRLSTIMSKSTSTTESTPELTRTQTEQSSTTVITTGTTESSNLTTITTSPEESTIEPSSASTSTTDETTRTPNSGLEFTLDECVAKFSAFSYNIATGGCSKADPSRQFKAVKGKAGKDIVVEEEEIVVGCNPKCKGSYVYLPNERDVLCYGPELVMKWEEAVSIDSLCTHNTITTTVHDGKVVNNMPAVKGATLRALIYPDSSHLISSQRVIIQKDVLYRKATLLTPNNMTCEGGRLEYCNDEQWMKMSAPTKISQRLASANSLCYLSCDNQRLELIKSNKTSHYSYSTGSHILLESGLMLTGLVNAENATVNGCMRREKIGYMCTVMQGNETHGVLPCFFYADKGYCYSDSHDFVTNLPYSVKKYKYNMQPDQFKLTFRPEQVITPYVNNVKENSGRCVIYDETLVVTEYGVFGSRIPAGISIEIDVVCSVFEVDWAADLVTYEGVQNFEKTIFENTRTMMKSGWCGDVIKSEPWVNCLSLFPISSEKIIPGFISSATIDFEANGYKYGFRNYKEDCGVNVLCIQTMSDWKMFNRVMMGLLLAVLYLFMLGGLAQIWRLYTLVVWMWNKKPLEKLKCDTWMLQNVFNFENTHLEARSSIVFGSLYEYFCRHTGIKYTCKQSAGSEASKTIAKDHNRNNLIRKIQYYTMLIFPTYTSIAAIIQIAMAPVSLILLTPVSLFMGVNPLKLWEVVRAGKETKPLDGAGARAEILKHETSSTLVESSGTHGVDGMKTVVKTKTRNKYKSNLEGKKGATLLLRVCFVVWWLMIGPVEALQTTVITSCTDGLCESSLQFTNELLKPGIGGVIYTDLVNNMGDNVGYLKISMDSVTFHDKTLYDYSIPEKTEASTCYKDDDMADCDANCLTYWGLDPSDDAGGLIVGKCRTLAESDYANALSAYDFTVESDLNNGFCAMFAVATSSFNNRAMVFRSSDVKPALTAEVKVEYMINDDAQTFNIPMVTMDHQYDWGAGMSNHISIRTRDMGGFDISGGLVGCWVTGGVVKSCGHTEEDYATEAGNYLKYKGEGKDWYSVRGTEPEVTCTDGGTGGDVKCGCKAGQPWMTLSEEDYMQDRGSFMGQTQCKAEYVLGTIGSIGNASFCKDPTYKTQTDCETNIKSASNPWVSAVGRAHKTLDIYRKECYGYEFEVDMVYKTEYNIDYEGDYLHPEEVLASITGCSGLPGRSTLTLSSQSQGKIQIEGGTVIASWSGTLTPAGITLSATIADSSDMYLAMKDWNVNEVVKLPVTSTESIEDCPSVCGGSCTGGDVIGGSGEGDLGGLKWWEILLIVVGCVAALVVIIFIIRILVPLTASRKKRKSESKQM